VLKQCLNIHFYGADIQNNKEDGDDNSIQSFVCLRAYSTAQIKNYKEGTSKRRKQSKRYTHTKYKILATCGIQAIIKIQKFNHDNHYAARNMYCYLH
jgi:hypothetical protein